MRAAVYRAEGSASDVLGVEELDIPEPRPGFVRVKVSYSAVNPTDVKSRAGLTPRPIHAFQVPHHDGAGVIDAVGEGVDPSRIGERVWLMLAANDNPYGTAAEYCIVPSEFARPLPSSASFALGATLGVPAVTAAYCLLSGGPIDGAQILVHGGAGAVGRYAVQLAHWLGADVVATASTPEKQATARAAGASLVVDYRDPTAAEQIRTALPRLSRIIEVDLVRNLPLDLAVSNPGTVIVNYAADGEDPVLPRRALMRACVSLEFMLLYNVRKEMFWQSVETVQQALDAGALTMPPHAIHSLTDIAAVHESQERGSSERLLVALGES